MTQSEVQRQTIGHLPVVLNEPLILGPNRIFCHAAEIPQTAESAIRGLRHSQKIIPKGVSCEVAAEVEYPILIRPLVIPDHQPADIAAELPCVAVSDPGECLTRTIVQVVLHDPQSVADEAARPGRIT